MRQETKEKLDRILRQKRRRQWLFFAAITLPFLALLIVFVEPRTRVDAYLAEVIGLSPRPSDDAGQLRLQVRLRDGGIRPLAAPPGSAQFSPGDTLCLLEFDGWITGRRSFGLMPATRCAALD